MKLMEETTNVINGFHITNKGDGDKSVSRVTLSKYDGTDAEVEIPHGVTYVGKEAFAGNTTMTKVTIPNTVVVIGPKAFESCTNLTQVEIKGKYAVIVSDGVFENCVNLTTINLPPHTDGLSENMFKGCKRLRDIKLPDEVNTIGFHCFDGCESLVSLRFPREVGIFGEAFINCPNLKYLFIQNDIRTIADNMFTDEQWKSVYIICENPKFVEHIRKVFKKNSDHVVTSLYQTTFFDTEED